MSFWRCIFSAALLFQAVDICAAPTVWRARDIANFTSEPLNLRKGEEVVGRISPSRVRAILQVKDKIEQQAGISAELVVLEGAEPNAFATPSSKVGPLVAINLGMIELIGDDMDGYAALLGHEYAHLTLRHRDTRQGREALQTAASVLLGVLLGRAGVQFGGTISDIATTAVATTFTRDEERDADKVGLGYAVVSGYDPQGGVRLWERMSARGSASIPFLSTHPASSERVATMRQLTAQHSSVTRVASTATARNESNTPTENQVPPVVATRSPTSTETDFGGVKFGLSREGIFVTAIDASARTDLKVNDRLERCKHTSYPGLYILADIAYCKGEFIVRRDETFHATHVSRSDDAKANEVSTVSSSPAAPSENASQQSQEDLHSAQIAVSKNPQDPELWRNLGRLYEQSGEMNHAIRAYRKAVDLDPRDIKTLEVLGGLYARTSQKERLREVWEALRRVDKAAAESFFAAHVIPQ